MNTMRRMVCALAAVGLVLGVAANAQAQAKKFKIIFPTTSETLTLPYLVAQQQGWLDADLTTVAGDANALRALLSGGGDVAVVGDFNVFSAISENAQIKAISSWQGVNDYQMIVSPKITRIQDMAGKVFASTGPGGPPEEFSKLLFKKYGVDLSKIQYVSIAGGGHAGLLQAVMAGRADAGLVNTVTALQGEKSGKAKILYSVAREFPNLGYVYNVARNGDLNNPALKAALDNFVVAGIKAARYIVDHPADAIKLAQTKFPDSDPQLLAQTINKLVQDKVWGVNGGIEPASTTDTLDIYRKTGLLKHDITLDQIFDQRYVTAAIAQLGKR
jgi:NitT/TauT family transport system substrate-binding protein